MTEKEAWRLCAMLWMFSREDGGGLQVYSALAVGGICPTIMQLRSAKLITKATAWKMQAKIDRLPGWKGSPTFKFPTDRAGAQARADFCMKQYRKLGGK